MVFLCTYVESAVKIPQTPMRGCWHCFNNGINSDNSSIFDKTLVWQILSISYLYCKVTTRSVRDVTVQVSS